MGMLIGSAHSSEKSAFDNSVEGETLLISLTTYLDCSPVIVVKDKEYKRKSVRLNNTPAGEVLIEVKR